MGPFVSATLPHKSSYSRALRAPSAWIAGWTVGLPLACHGGERPRRSLSLPFPATGALCAELSARRSFFLLDLIGLIAGASLVDARGRRQAPPLQEILTGLFLPDWSKTRFGVWATSARLGVMADDPTLAG
jgi:hypothetical protein